MKKTFCAIALLALGVATLPTFVSPASAQMERHMERRMMHRHMEHRMMRHERHMMHRRMMHRM